MVTRRHFHKLLGSAALTALSGVGTDAYANTPTMARLHLNRLTFGATQDEIARFDAMGIRAWLDAELSKTPSSGDIKERLADAQLEIEYDGGKSNDGRTYQGLQELRPYQYTDYDPQDVLQFLDFDLPIDWQERIRPAAEIRHASLIRAVHADAQLREVMTQFWHEHFSVNSAKDETTAIFFPKYDTVMRTHALGNFRALLGDVARAPSMLFYLNNEASRASPANENYARELLELHTLGAEHYYNDLYDDWRAVPGAEIGAASGYIDQDVYEVARAFTGWSVGDGRWIDEGTYAPKTGRFEYIEAWHDPYQKRILGREFAPNRAPMADGDEVLDLLAAHPGTAKFVSRKIMRALGLETPSRPFLARVADSFLQHKDQPDQIAQVIRAIVLDPDFAATPPTKLRRPFEFLAALYRISGAQITTTHLRHDWFLSRAGWTQHEVRPPTGHSDTSKDWANTRTLNAMVDMALYAHDDWAGMVDIDLSTPMGAQTFGDLARLWETRFDLPNGALDMGIEYVLAEPDSPLPSDDPDHIAWASTTFLSMGALSTAHLFR